MFYAWVSVIRNARRINVLLLRKWSYREFPPWRRSACTKHWNLLRFYSLIILVSTHCRNWLLPFESVNCDDKSDQTNSLHRKQELEQQQPQSKPIGLIIKLLRKMEAYFIGHNENGVQAPALFNQNMHDRSGSDYPTRLGNRRETFRDMTIREYENRLRVYSRPEKIFNYFATIMTKNDAGEWEVFMTPIDFSRSIMPGFRQPEDLGLNKFRKMSRKRVQKLMFKGLNNDSIFYKLRPDGLLSYSDYLYLVMLMSMPDRYFKIGFRLFDQQGNGNLSKEDMDLLLLGFNKDCLKTHSSVGYYFFGPKLNKKLSHSRFQEFKNQLKQEILMIQFHLLRRKRKPTDTATNLKNKTISELSFAKVLLTYSNMPQTQKIATLKRIMEKYKHCPRGIELSEFILFFKFVDELPAIDSALTYYFFAGADISPSTLKHISDVVGASLSPHVIDIIFAVFDDDRNGIIGREFIQIVRHRMSRGQSNRIKFSSLCKIVLKCTKDTLFV